MFDITSETMKNHFEKFDDEENKKAYEFSQKLRYYDMVTDVENTKRNKAVRLTERNLTAIQGDLPKGFELPQIAVVDFNKITSIQMQLAAMTGTQKYCT